MCLNIEIPVQSDKHTSKTNTAEYQARNLMKINKIKNI